MNPSPLPWLFALLTGSVLLSVIGLTAGHSALEHGGAFCSVCLATQGAAGTLVLASSVVALAWLSRTQRQRLERDQMLERRAAHADRLALIGTLTAGVAHELRGPLTAIALGVDELRGCGVDDELIEDLRQSQQKLSQLARDLTEFSRRQGREERAEAGPVVESVLRMAAPRLRHRHRVKHDLDRLPPLAIDPQSLEQVLLNLVVNAVDATPEGGQILISGRVQGEQAVLAVQDDGPGIAASVQEELFSAFATTKAPGEGTGLGLFISRRLVEENGGELALAHSEFGARFELRLGLAAEVCCVPEGHYELSAPASPG